MNRPNWIPRSWQAVCLACLLAASFFISTWTADSQAAGLPPAPCTITLLQDTATVGQPAVALVALKEGILEEAVSCVWAYRFGPDWVEVPAVLEDGRVAITPDKKGWLKLVVTLHREEGSQSFTSNTMPVLFPVSPIACRIDTRPVGTEQGPALEARWTVTPGPEPLEISTRWYGAGRRLDTGEQQGLQGSSLFLPEEDGKIRFVVEVLDANGQASTFDGGLMLAHTANSGLKQVVTSGMLKTRVAEVAAACREEAEDSYSQARWLHDFLARSAYYDAGYTLYDPHGVLLLGTGVCQSFAMAYQLLLTEMGIPNRYVTGLGRGGSGWDRHAWNLVQLDGQWYHVDVTWDERGGHAYFLKSDDYMKKTHSWAFITLPEAPGNYTSAPGSKGN